MQNLFMKHLIPTSQRRCNDKGAYAGAFPAFRSITFPLAVLLTPGIMV